MAFKAIHRVATALLLATVLVFQLQLPQVGAEIGCEDLDDMCTNDDICSDCREAAGPYLDVFERCVDYYLWDDDVCINQSMQPCCQDKASPIDCVANANYTAYYNCRLQTDVGGDCTTLSCDAVGTASPTPVGFTESESGAGRASPLVAGRWGDATGPLLAMATALSLTAAAAAAFA